MMTMVFIYIDLVNQLVNFIDCRAWILKMDYYFGKVGNYMIFHIS